MTSTLVVPESSPRLITLSTPSFCPDPAAPTPALPAGGQGPPRAAPGPRGMVCSGRQLLNGSDDH